MGQVSTHIFPDTDRIKVSTYPQKPYRPPSPTRQPHYAVAQNKVLPFAFPQKPLRRVPDYRKISYDSTDGHRRESATTNGGVRRSSQEMGVSESKDLTKESEDNLGYISTDICTENGVTPNGYRNFKKSFSDLQNYRWDGNGLIENNEERRGKPYFRSKSETYDYSGKPGAKSCLVDNGQIINLPRKSSSHMDYSFAVTYAQLAKHRRLQNFQKIQEQEEEMKRKEQSRLFLVNQEKNNDSGDGKVKYRAPPPPMKSGVEPPVDYDESEDSDVSDGTAVPSSQGDGRGPSKNNEVTKKTQLNNAQNRDRELSNQIDEPRKESVESFAVVDESGRIVSHESVSPTIEKTKRLSSLLQHDIINAALIRQTKLKRKTQRIPALKTPQEVCQSELAKICEERERRLSVINARNEKKADDNADAKEFEISGKVESNDLQTEKGDHDQRKVIDVETDVDSHGLSDISFEKVEIPTDHTKEYEIIASDEVASLGDGKIEEGPKSGGVMKNEKINGKRLEAEVDKRDSFDDGDCGTQVSHLSKDWTPEHDLDLEESEDEQISVLTSKKKETSEGFKKSVLPSQGMGNTVNMKAPKTSRKDQFTSLLKFKKSVANSNSVPKCLVISEIGVKGDDEADKRSLKNLAGMDENGCNNTNKEIVTVQKVKANVDDSKIKQKSEGGKQKMERMTVKSDEVSLDSFYSDKNPSTASVSNESDEIKNDFVNLKEESSRSLEMSVTTANMNSVDAIKERGAKKVNKRVKKMKKFGYLSTAKKKEKKRLQLYLQDQIDQQERKIEAERRKQRDIEKQIRSLEKQVETTDDDDDDDDNDDDAEVVYKKKKDKVLKTNGPMPVQYVSPIAYPVQAMINPQVSLNPNSSNQVPTNVIPTNFSGWYGNTASVASPSGFNMTLPYGGMNATFQIPAVPPTQPAIPYEVMQYMRMLEQSQQMANWSSANSLNANTYQPTDQQKAALVNWLNNSEKQTAENNQEKPPSGTTQPNVRPPTNMANKTSQQKNVASNNVVIDDALLCAMMNDYKQNVSSNERAKSGSEERSNPLYDSSEDEADYGKRSQSAKPEKVTPKDSSVADHNAAVYGPKGYRPINFSPQVDSATVGGHP